MDQASFVHLRTHIWKLLREQQAAQRALTHHPEEEDHEEDRFASPSPRCRRRLSHVAARTRRR